MTPSDSTPSPDQLEEVFNSIDAVEVGMARDLLESSGMECFVFDASASQMLGSTAAITVRLMVPRRGRSRSARGPEGARLLGNPLFKKVSFRGSNPTAHGGAALFLYCRANLS